MKPIKIWENLSQPTSVDITATRLGRNLGGSREILGKTSRYIRPNSQVFPYFYATVVARPVVKKSYEDILKNHS